MSRRRDPSRRPETAVPAPDRPRGDPFGTLLPDGTRDEDATGWGEDDEDREESLRREVPPHH